MPDPGQSPIAGDAGATGAATRAAGPAGVAASPAAAARTLLGFDFGVRRVGVAIGNTITGHARPLAIVREMATDRRFAAIGGLIESWRPDAFVVGRPLHPDGAAHAVTAAAERFARQLEGRYRRPVTLVDERYSTAEARARAREDGDSLDDGDDAHAAAIILEQYLGSLAVVSLPSQEHPRP